MNQSVVHQSSSAVQQMMMAAANGNPNFFSINHMKPPPTHLQPPPPLPTPSLLLHQQPHYTPTPSSSSSSSSSSSFHEEFPESWSQLLLGSSSRLVGESNWEDQLIQHQISSNVNVKQEHNNMVYGHASNEIKPTSSWSQLLISPPPPPLPLPTNNMMLDFSSTPPECNGNGVMNKKARVQPSTSSTNNTTFKVRKEKLGDRITALHQLVSPFGKTDTASVLLEAIGYIRFLQSQIEALSLPYLGSGSPNLRQQQSVQGERNNSIFPEDPGQLVNEKCMKKRKGEGEGEVEEKRDLRSRGLCLVPVSCTVQVGSENGADYWAPALAGFR